MASSVEKELTKHLECGICLERFEEPKVLRCQHSYCKKCLERLVTRDEITCPECRTKTKVQRGDVKSLPTNFFINNLLSIRGNDQSNASSSPPCQKHDGEILKLFCKSCDQFICRDCALIDHRDHEYTFIKDILPDAKREISEIVKKSRENICALESSIEKIKDQEDNMHKNVMEVNLEVDNLIDNQIKLLERKRRSVKDDLQTLVDFQKEILDVQMESFQTSLGCLKSSVEFTEEALTRGSDVEILSAKNQMIQQLNELNSKASDLKPRGRIHYKLASFSPLSDCNTLKNIAKIIEYDENYIIRKRFHSSDLGEKLWSYRIIPQNKSNTFDIAEEEVVVKITEPGTENVQFPVVTKHTDGSFTFKYRRDNLGHYMIVVIINGRFVLGSPFNSKDISSPKCIMS